MVKKSLRWSDLEFLGTIFTAWWHPSDLAIVICLFNADLCKRKTWIL